MKILILLGLAYLQTSSSAPLKDEKPHFPVGTIIAWKPKNEYDTSIPCGWELCNGQIIEDKFSPLVGSQMPSLNTETLFLRGSSEEATLGKIQADAIPDHGHETRGHTHRDSGHTHTDKGHEHKVNAKIPFMVLAQGGTWGDDNGSPRWATAGHYPPFQNDQMNLTKANIQMSHAEIGEGHLSISGVKDARIDSETRPKNVKYPYIVKVTDGNCQNINDKAASVVAWLPGQQVLDPNSWKESEQLNKLEVFLRGGAPANTGNFEMDSMQEHSHQDLGHSHKDIGHTHKDQGHFHQITQTYDVLRPGSTWGDKDGSDRFGSQIDMDSLFDTGHADIEVSQANIEVASEIIENAVDTTVGSETRPDNIQLVWIEGNTALSPEYFPVGSIIAWLPILNHEDTYKLPLGWVECNGKHNKTPDINGKHLFIRGGDSKTAGRFQDFQLQNHKHNDLGHTHKDAGHTHVDSGHNLGTYYILIPGQDYGDDDGSDRFAKQEEIHLLELEPSRANIQMSRAEIDATKAVVKGVTSARTSDEVRPKNMAVKFIMKIY